MKLRELLLSLVALCCCGTLASAATIYQLKVFPAAGEPTLHVWSGENGIAVGSMDVFIDATHTMARAAQWNRATSSSTFLAPVQSEARVADGGRFAGQNQAHPVVWTNASTIVDYASATVPTGTIFGMRGSQQVGAGGSPVHAYMWNDSAGSVTSLHPAGYDQSYAFATDGVHQVGDGYIGSANHALLWSGSAGSVVDLDPVDWAFAEGLGVDGAYQVGAVGWQTNQSPTWHAALWSGSAASFVDLNPGPSYNYSYAQGVRNGKVVGWGRVTTVGSHAIVWDVATHAATDLNSYATSAGFTGSAAYAIDAQGVIYGNVGDGSRAFAAIWTPLVPEPGSLLLVLIPLMRWQMNRTRRNV